MSDDLIDTGAVAALLGVTVDTVKAWRYRNTGPAFVRLPGGRIAYRRLTVEVWNRDHRRRKEKFQAFPRGMGTSNAKARRDDFQATEWAGEYVAGITG